MANKKANFFSKIIYKFLSLPLRLKISIPYLFIATLLAGLATFQVSVSFAETLESRLRAQLEDGAARVAEAVIDIEERHLQMLRTMSFTTGVPEALDAKDSETLQELIFPIMLNQDITYVELLDTTGQPVITWHKTSSTGREYEENIATDYAAWDIVQAILTKEQDELGTRFADVIETPWGPALYTSGPVQSRDGELRGVLLVGTPLEAVALELRDVSIADISIYSPEGIPTASTLIMDASTRLTPELHTQIQTLMQAENPTILLRNIQSNERQYIETLEPFHIRAAATGWNIGISLPESIITDVQGPNLWQLILIFAFGILALVGLGVIIAQIIALPVFRLVSATEQVSDGDFDLQVEVSANDELGYLTKGFNLMVTELQQREFIRDVFGKMVSEEVREAVLEGSIVMGGELRDVTVLFTDIRGFTSFSEQLNPQEIISALNDFFGVVSKATKRHHGMINSYGGDSALVVFGAPIERPQLTSIEQAIRAAMDIRLGATLLNAQRISENLHPLHFGVGINSGQVIAGNLGTEDRFEYTVIGDAVNIAARLQGLARRFPSTPLLITAENVAPVNEQLDINFKDLGKFDLKGKEKSVGIYGILETSSAIPEGFALFDTSKYPRVIALLASYLHCMSYTPEIVAKALEIDIAIVENWLKVAQENPKIVGDILVAEFSLPRSITNRLKLVPVESEEA